MAVSGQITRLAVSTFEDLASPSSPLAVVGLPRYDESSGNITLEFRIPITRWNFRAGHKSFEDFLKYVTQDDSSFPRPGFVLVSFREVRMLPGFAKMVNKFERYHSYIQWIVAAREHDQVFQTLSGHICQVISVTQVEVNAPSDGYRSCEERRVITGADVGMLAERVPHAGRLPKDDRVVFANLDDSSKLCYKRGNFITLAKLAYASLNTTVVEVCNNGETDSLLLDRRVDFVLSISKRVPMRSYYGHQQQRLMLAIEESGFWLHHIRMRSRHCSNDPTLAVFDIPFSDYATIYLVGCSLSLLAFAAEVAYQRYFLARRLQSSPPAVVIRHR
ncbi:hypothetical protein MTO96_007999 [Rhipicephalus appendiculatus]